MTTYYVATNGDNTNNGTSISTPWRTIQYGVSHISAGDTLYIRGGTYVEVVSVPDSASGTAGAHTTIAAYSGETPIIDGQYAIPGGANHGSLQQAIDAGFVQYVGPNYRYVPTGATVYPTSNSPLFDVNGNYIDIIGLTITRSKGRGLRLNKWPAGSTTRYKYRTVQDCDIGNHRWHGMTVYGDYDTIDNCVVHHSSNFAPFTRPAYSAKRSGANTTPGINWGSGIAQAESRWMTVKNCKIHSHWGEGIILVEGTTVENCEIYRCYSAHAYIESADQCTLRNNLIWHDGNGFLRNGGNATGINVTNEYNGSPGSGSGNGARVYNNIVVGCGSGIAHFAGDGYYEDIRIFNNTIINPFNPNNTDAFLVKVGSARMNDVYYYNNIFYSSLPCLVVNTSKVETGSTGAQFYNNCWYGNFTLPARAKGTGDIYANPKMRNPNASITNGPIAGNYQLLEDSPCINESVSTPQAPPTTDYFANARSEAADLGSLEYGGTISKYLYPNFTASNVVGQAPLSVALTDASSSSETITARYWSYRATGAATWSTFNSGNNTSVTLQINSPGTYDVRLRCVTATQDTSEIKTGLITATAENVDPGDPGGTGSPGASGVIGVAAVAANTTTGTQVIALNNSSITPTFVLVQVSAATDGENPAAGAIVSIGMSDGTRTRSTGATTVDAVATSVAGRSNRADNLIVINDSSTKRDAYADLVSFGAGTVTINWVVAPPAGYTIHVWAAAATSAYVADVTVADSMAVTAPGFQPDAILWLAGFGVFPSSGAGAINMFGITTADTSGAISTYWENGSAAGDNNGYVFDGSIGIASASGGRLWEFTPTISANGFTSGAISGSAFGSIAYACLVFADNAVWLDVVDTPTSTGTVENTTPAFPAGAGLSAFTTMTTVNSGVTGAAAGSYAFGMWAGSAQYCLGVSNEHGADPTDAASHKNALRFIRAMDDDGVTVALQAYIAVNANGYDLSWETVQPSACKGLLFVVEGDAPSTGGESTAPDVVAYGRAYANTTTGNQTIDLNAAITPTAAIFKLTGVTSGSNPHAAAVFSVGITDGTNVRCVAIAAEDNVADSNAGRVSRNDNILVVNNYTTGRSGYATFVSFAEGQVTINWAVAPAEAYLIEVMAFVADSAYVGDKTIASSMTETGPNFESDAIFWLAGAGSLLSSSNDAIIALGVTTADTTGMIGVGWDDAQASGANSGYMIDGAAVQANPTGGRIWEFVPTITSTGWTGTLTGTVAGAIAFLAMRFASNAVWCDVIDSPTSTGTVENTAPAFPAGGGLAIISALTASGAAEIDGNAGAFALGMWADDAQAATGITNENAADPTDTASHDDGDSFIKLMDDDGATVMLDATVAQADEGFALAWATANATPRKIVVFAVEGSLAPLPPHYDWFEAGTGIGAGIGMP